MRPRSTVGAAVTTLAVALAVFPPAAGAATIPVTSSADNQTDDQLCTLREALLAAQNNSAENPAGGVDCPAGQGGPTTDTVAIGDLPPIGPGEDIITLGSSLTFSVSAGQGPVVIDGRGRGLTTVDANDTGRVFGIGGDTSATFRDLTVANGTVANGNGGGIRSFAADITLDNVAVSHNTLTGNAALSFGGGISVNLGTLAVSDSTIFNNSISGISGTVRGGGIHLTGAGGATIDRTTVIGNTVTNTNAMEAVQGGGIVVEEAAADVTITNSLISSNILSGGASHEGGGVHWTELDSNGPALEIQNTTFSANDVGTGTGGGLFLDGGDVSIAHATFGPNTAGSGRGVRRDNLGLGTMQIRGSIFETGGEDCSPDSLFISLGHNVEETGPDCDFDQATDLVLSGSLLDTLEPNGGPTETHAFGLDADSFLDSIPPASCLGADGAPLTQDQRGAPRQFDDGTVDTGPNCDPGAYEEALCNSEPARVIGTPGADTLNGTVGTEMILGLGGADVIRPGAGSDRICAGDGDDLVHGGDDDGSPDSYHGGNGSDTYDLTDFNGGATVNLATGGVQPSGSLGVEFIDSLENVLAGDGNDILTGDAGPNRLDGASGNDMITGAGGSDLLLGNFGNLDALFARDGVFDLVDCGIGTGDTAQTDQLSLDAVSNCESVDALPEPPVITPTVPASNPPATPKKKCKKKKRKRSSAAAKKCKRKRK